VTGNTRQ